MKPKNVAVILAAAGKSTRFGDSHLKKVFTSLAGRAVWLHAADVFLEHPQVGQVIVVIDAEDKELFKEKYTASTTMMGIDVVLGGDQRWKSVQNALEMVRPEMEWIAVHDAARPCVTQQLIDDTLAAAMRFQAAIPATPIHGTVKRANAKQNIAETVNRDGLWQAQTPQIFKKDLLLRAYAMRGSLNPTDDAQLVEQLGVEVAIVNGSMFNIKITTKEDLRFAELSMKSKPTKSAFPFGD